MISCQEHHPPHLAWIFEHWVSLQVLILAGPEGLTIPDIIDTANSLGLTGPTQWETSGSKKSSVSQVHTTFS